MKCKMFFTVLLIAALLSGITPVSSQGVSTGRAASSPDFPAFQTSSAIPEPTARPAPGTWRCYPDGTPDPCHAELYDVELFSPTYGWAVGSALMHWDGRQWIKDQTSPPGNFTTVVVLSETDAWAAGWGGVIHWDGNRWLQSLPGPGTSLWKMDMVSSTDGWGAVEEHLYHWDGQDWTHYGGFVGINVSAIDMISEQDGWAVGYGGFLLHWDGHVWNRTPSPAGDEFILGLTMLGSQDGWATTSSGHILHWGGRTWSIAAHPTSQPLEEIAFAAPNDGWAITSDGTFFHFDGRNWKEDGHPTGLSINGISLSGTIGWAVGKRGVLVHREGDTWQADVKPSTGEYMKLSANSPTDVWIYEAIDRVMHWDGHVWQDFPALVGQVVVGMEMLSPNDGWAITYTGIQHWDGISWIPVPSPVIYGLNDIDMLSEQDGWIAGSQGLLRWDGSAWQKWPWVTLRIWDLEMVTPTAGWAIADLYGNKDHLLYWDGTSWTDTGVDNMVLFDLDARTPDDAWAVGNAVLHWDGAAWQQLPGSPLGAFQAVSAAGPQDVWLAGVSDTSSGFFHWNGMNWWYGSSPAGTYIKDMAVFSQWEGWAISETGAILNYDGPQPALSLSASDGQPGSTFQVTGANFPPGYLAEIMANGQFLGTVTPDTAGSFTFLIRTNQAEVGSYFLSVTAREAPASMSNTSTVILHLNTDTPLREQGGDGPTFDLPPGIAYSQEIYYPIISK